MEVGPERSSTTVDPAIWTSVPAPQAATNCSAVSTPKKSPDGRFTQWIVRTTRFCCEEPSLAHECVVAVDAGVQMTRVRRGDHLRLPRHRSRLAMHSRPSRRCPLRPARDLPSPLPSCCTSWTRLFLGADAASTGLTHRYPNAADRYPTRAAISMNPASAVESQPRGGRSGALRRTLDFEIGMRRDPAGAKWASPGVRILPWFRMLTPGTCPSPGRTDRP
jgi:hypothetical protein